MPLSCKGPSDHFTALGKPVSEAGRTRMITTAVSPWEVWSITHFSVYLKTLSYSWVVSQGLSSVLLHVSPQPPPFRGCRELVRLGPGKWTSYLVDKEALGHTLGIRGAQGCRKWKITSALKCGVFKEKEKGYYLANIETLGNVPICGPSLWCF